MSVIKSGKIYSTQDYCWDFLGECPFVTGEKDELRKLLDKEGYPELWDYPIDEIEHIVENGIPVVLVDTTYTNDDCEMVHELRWFQIPFSFDYIERATKKQFLYDNLSDDSLREIDGILEAYFNDRIDIVEKNTDEDDSEDDGEYKLVINDKCYEETGNELIVLKWIEGYEETAALFERFS